MAGPVLYCVVDDKEMLLAIDKIATKGLKSAARRSVQKTARAARVVLIQATKNAMNDDPGGYAPFSAGNFKRPRVKTTAGGISASTGYTSAGYIDRFRSTGTGPRSRKNGGYTGVEQGMGMVQQAANVADPMFPQISQVELGIELRKANL